MESWFLPIVITVALVAHTLIVYSTGRADERRKWVRYWGRTFGYRPTSPPTQQSGTPEPERGSDDTE